MRNITVGIVGETGVGKSTFINWLLERNPDYTGILEPFKENHFFSAASLDKRHFFNNQFEFLIRFADSYKKYGDTKGVIIRDRIIEEVQIFTGLGYENGWLTQSQFNMLTDAFEYLNEPVDFVIRLYATPETLVQRVKERNRKQEEGLTLEYFKCLISNYDEYFGRTQKESVVLLDWTNPSRRLDRYLLAEEIIKNL